MGLGYGPDDFPMDGWGREKEEAMGHFRENCRICQKVLRQCRCACCNQEQRWTICADCQAKETKPEAGKRRFKVTVARQEIVEMDFVVDVAEEKAGYVFTLAAAKVEADKKARNTEYPRANAAEYEVTNVKEIK